MVKYIIFFLNKNNKEKCWLFLIIKIQILAKRQKCVFRNGDFMLIESEKITKDTNIKRVKVNLSDDHVIEELLAIFLYSFWLINKNKIYSLYKP